MQWIWKRKTDVEHFQTGMKKLQRGDISGAIHCWNAAIQLNPRHIDALLQRGDLKRRQADYPGALSDLNRALDYAPTTAKAYYFKSLVWLDRNNEAAALEELCTHIYYQNDCDNTIVRQPFKQQENPDAVIRWLTGLAQEATSNASILLARALAFFQLKKFGNALHDLNRAIAADESLDAALLLRGKILLTCGESESAVEDLTKMIARGSHEAQAHLLRGQARADLGDFDGARLDFGRSIQLAPMESAGYTKLAAIHSIQGNYSDVITFSDAAINLNSKETEAYCYRAVARRVHGDLAGSIADCIYAIQMAPDDHLPYMVRAMTFIEANKLNYALNDADRAVKLAPKRARPYLTRGLVWQHRGNFEKANQDMSEAIRLDKHFLDAYRSRAQMREQFEDMIGALRDYQHLHSLAEHLEESEELEMKISEIRAAISQSLVKSLELDRPDPQIGGYQARYAHSSLSSQRPVRR